MEKRKYFTAHKVATLGLMTAFGLIMFMVENLFPPMFFPGAKMGLSNVFSLLTLFIYGLPEALFVTVARTVLGSLFAGNFSLLLYSLTAGIASVCLSRILLFAFPRISVVCISVLSAVIHNTVQLLVYTLLWQTTIMFGYYPYLVLLGILAGVIVGLVVYFAIKGIPLSVFYKVTDEKVENVKK